MARTNSEEEMRPMPFEESSKRLIPSDFSDRRRTKKWIVLAVSVVGFITCMVFASIYGVDYETSETSPEFVQVESLSSLEQPRECGKRDEVANMTIWNAAVNKTSHLIEDKFTIALQTYRRPEQLKQTLGNLTLAKTPSLLEIVVVWNDVDNEPPKDYTANNSVPVRFRRSEENSLNQKLLPDSEFKTQGVLLSDEDWNYNTENGDLEYVFQHWRRTGMNRLTGAFGRCWRRNKNGVPLYSLCGRDYDRTQYQMVLTGLAFTHVSFLEYYWSDDSIMTSVREYVDETFNCEDIALNFVTSMLTCEGPQLVFGMTKLTHQAANVSISKKPGHLNSRHRCMKQFIDLFGYMPLHNVDSHTRRGVIALS